MSQTAGAEPVWEQKLDDAALRLAEEATAEALADVYGGDQSFVDDLCSEVVSVAIDQGDNVVTMDHFATAADRLDAVPENDDTDTDRHVAPHREMKGDGAGGEVVASTTDVDEETIADIQADRQAHAEAEAEGGEDKTDDESEKPTESADSDPSESDTGEAETQPDTVVADGTEYVSREEYEELEAEVQELRGLLEALRRQVKSQTQIITGEEMVSSVDPDNPAFTDVMTRLQRVEDQAEENAASVQMVKTDGGAGTDTPDGRARLIRQVLFNKAKSAAEKTGDQAGTAEMTRDEVDSRLDGGHHRGTLMDVMRRAADGHEADINGSSDLPVVQSITFHKSNSQDKQSKLVMDLSQASGTEIRQNLTPVGTRQNLTTGDTEDGG